MFVDRESELEFLNSLLTRTRPSVAQLVLLYGRRRVGKTVLARQWAESTGVSTIYWAAEREPAGIQRRKLFAKMLGVTMTQAPTFEAWADLWSAFAPLLGDQKKILILDEVTHAAESDPAFLSALQHAWDQQLKNSHAIVLLSGSHVHTMETLLAQGSPLFGRFTGQLHLEPLEFKTLRLFVTKWAVAERVALYAIVGGVPAYLEWINPKASLTENLREVFLSKKSPFAGEPDTLLHDALSEPRMHRGILQAIGMGAHTLDEIAKGALIGKTHLPAYLMRLQELRFIERRLPVTVPPTKRLKSRQGRYHLTDSFLRFYFRFIAPDRAEVGFEPDAAVSAIQEHLRAFVGATAFEELCRLWVRRASTTKRLPFQIQDVGSHWSRHVQVDVVGINWSKKELVAGECKWGTDAVARDVLQDLLETKLPRMLEDLPDGGEGWKTHSALFSRAGFTPATRELAKANQTILVELTQLDRDLG
ncbi:MAG: ATP-binding protein [Chloroflexi bacterium]|nr:ATP-binding protein [Chloroflexota bacterium]